VERIPTLEVQSPGPLATVQDGGRFGFGKYGVPPSGALDPFSLRMANLLVGNPEQSAGIEITLMGFRARVLTDAVVAVTGGDLQPMVNQEELPMWSCRTVKKGDLLTFKGLKTGCRAYLALGGGVEVPVILESRSTNLSSGFGGLEGRPLRTGDTVLSASPRRYLKAAGQRVDPALIPAYGKQWSLRALLGPQGDEFPSATRQAFFSSSFTAMPESDRTGIRLGGPALHRTPDLPESIISEGVAPGTVQVPGDAQPIIILVETITGGYRKIATVITVDRGLLGQIKPGDAVRFQEVSMEEAVRALRTMEERICQWKEGLT